MSVTNIEWADRVWNPVTGCTKVSQGCKNCYAEGVAHRFFAKQYPPVVEPFKDGSGRLERPRRFTDVQTHADRLLEPLRWRKPARIFVNSMSDLFHEDVPFEFIDRVFAVMALCPQHTFLVLTKRPERMRAFLSDESAHARIEEAADWQRETIPTPLGYGLSATFQRAAAALGTLPWPYPNVHLGVSAENQPTLDERLPLLLQTPAAQWFLSLEPLLSGLDLAKHRPGANRLWVIVGGESGAGARPCDVRWIRSVVNQCKQSDTPVFVKQLGADPRDAGARPCWCSRDWRSTGPRNHQDACIAKYEAQRQSGLSPSLQLDDRKGGDPSEWPEDLRVRELPEVRA